MRDLEGLTLRVIYHQLASLLFVRLLTRSSAHPHRQDAPSPTQNPVCGPKHLCGCHAATGKYAGSHVPKEEATMTLKTHPHTKNEGIFAGRSFIL